MAQSGSLTFPAGSTAAHTVAVDVLGDAIDETNEAFSLQLSSPVHANLTRALARATIVDDDDPPSVVIGDVTLTEGQSGTKTFVFTLTLSGPSALTTRVRYETADGTALAGSDYSTRTGEVVFSPGAMTRTVSVPVIGDTVVEPDETFLVNLHTPVNLTIADAQAVRNDPERGLRRAQGSAGRRRGGPSAETTSTGMPLKPAVPHRASTRWSSVRSFRLTPAWACGTPRRVPGRWWPQPWGRQTTPGMTSLVTSSVACTDPTRDRTRTRWPSREPAARRVLGVHQQRAAVATLHQALAVVHPGVVGAQVAATDQPQAVPFALCRWGREPLQVLHQALGRELDAPPARAEAARQGGLERAQVDPVRRRFQRPQREAGTEGQKAGTVGAQAQQQPHQAARAQAAQHRVDQPRQQPWRPLAAASRRDSSSRISQSCRAPGAGANSGGENLAVLRTASVWKTRS